MNEWGRRSSMAKKPGKYAAALAAMNQPHALNQIALPLKPEPPKGKRSTAGWRQKAVLLKEESILRATERLRRRNDRTDFSDLMQALLEAWLDTPA
jgi:hypothetical protein